MNAGLSIVVPLYNEARGLARLHEQLSAVARTLTQKRGLAIEVVYVDDGSRDNTLEIARGLPANALDVQVVALSRNFGKEAALAAGLDHARRGAVLFMDGDGQHPPDLIETLVGHWLDGGYDVVYTAKGASRTSRRCAGSAARCSTRCSTGARATRFPRMPATSACSRRAPRCAAPHAGAQPLLQGARELDRLSGRCASTTSRPSARMARRRSASDR